MENKQAQTPSNKGAEATQEAGIIRVSKKIITWSVIAIAAVLVIAGTGYWIYQSGNNKANEAIAAADTEMNDSIQMEMYKQIAADGSYKANERAKLMVAIRYFNDGQYEDALNYLKDASVSSSIIQTGVHSLEGDCYANLNKYDEALKAFNKALDAADDNGQLIPFLMVKMANIYRAQQNYTKEAEIYAELRKEHPGFLYDVDKYYERAVTSVAE